MLSALVIQCSDAIYWPTILEYDSDYSTRCLCASLLPMSNVPLPVTSQDLVLLLDDDSMRRIVVGVGEYLRNVDASQPMNQEQQSPEPSSSSVSQTITGSSAGEESGCSVRVILSFGGYPIFKECLAMGTPPTRQLIFIGEQVTWLTLRPLFPPS